MSGPDGLEECRTESLERDAAREAFEDMLIEDADMDYGEYDDE